MIYDHKIHHIHHWDPQKLAMIHRASLTWILLPIAMTWTALVPHKWAQLGPASWRSLKLCELDFKGGCESISQCSIDTLSWLVWCNVSKAEFIFKQRAHAYEFSFWVGVDSKKICASKRDLSWNSLTCSSQSNFLECIFYIKSHGFPQDNYQ